MARRPRAEEVRLLAALGLTGADLADFRAAATAVRRTAAEEAAAELTALAVTGLAEASRRVAARPLIIVADPARLAEVEPLLSAAPTAWSWSPAPSSRPAWTTASEAPPEGTGAHC